MSLSPDRRTPEESQGVVRGPQLVPEGDVIVMVIGRDLGGAEVLVTPEQGGALQGREYRAGGRATHRAGNI